MTDAETRSLHDELTRLREDFDEFARSRVERDKQWQSRTWSLLLAFGIPLLGAVATAAVALYQVRQHEDAIVALQQADSAMLTRLFQDLGAIREGQAGQAADIRALIGRVDRFEDRLDRALNQGERP